jgi:hypothetical protein
MAHSFLIFDFGTNEEAAQQARHKLEGWKQGFRLDKKILLKFEREETEAADDSGDEAAKHSKGAKKSAAKLGKSGKDGAGARVRLLVRLDFSDHEKLSHQRWLDRIPAEEPFKSVDSEVIRPGESDFEETEEHFNSLE